LRHESSKCHADTPLALSLEGRGTANVMSSPCRFQEVEAFIEVNQELLEPQRHGWLRIRNYFSSDQSESNAPALVIIPTGCGKTGLMAITPFGVARGRVLVVTPGVVVNEGVLESLDSSSPDNFWLKYNVLFNGYDLPAVVRFRSDLPDSPLHMADMVVANIQQTMSRNRGSLVNRVAPDFFDMIIVDEGHHAPAESWRYLFQYFSEAKKVLVTGTPFRGDGISIYGNVAYEYTLGQAMRAGLVKRIIEQKHIDERLEFTVDGMDSRLSLDEVLEIKDQEWVNRSVAYSPECTRQVVIESLKLLEEKRRTGTPHKILASACSIAHAEQIRDIYEQEGSKATVVHSTLNDETRASSVRDFEQDRYQVIVHVNMLGEGYDHPNISIVAMFKPYRSLNQYVQFAGRALRVIRNTDHDDIDNVAHLVYHNELGLEKLWEYYKNEAQRATTISELENEMSAVWNDEEPESDGYECQPWEIGTVTPVGLRYAARESFLEDYDIIASYDRAKEALQSKLENALEALRVSGVSVTPELEEAILASMRKESLRSKRPDLELSETRSAFVTKVENEVAELLNECAIDPHAKDGFLRLRSKPQYSWMDKNRGQTSANNAFLVILINQELMKHVGRPRKEWTLKDYTSAEDRLCDILELLRAHARGNIQ